MTSKLNNTIYKARDDMSPAKPRAPNYLNRGMIMCLALVILMTIYLCGVGTLPMIGSILIIIGLGIVAYVLATQSQFDRGV